ncbi:hypothetical protein MACH09_21870 [Vibrio sp. MACH09]|uniref:exodeoxyribonuclease V subunit alpha n=1 Tax=Vibrio sp. MACH09 TaxID=3025122 RepID=UPI0027911C14|nr:exodeoxyribonuclease V subunit alpha [Vibrio sp. MACH09]GLO61679.1 hypothetical protein MACH09_21870 [Vibrio sp. MACH09]
MLSLLESLCQKGTLRQLDYQFAKFIASMEHHHPQPVALLACAVSHELAKGNICLNVEQFNVAACFGLYGERAKEIEQKSESINWREIVTSSSTIGDGKGQQPLVFDGKRVYLQRYWYYQQQLASKLNQLAQPIPLTQSEMLALSATLTTLFSDSESLNWQKVAAAVALTRRLAVISGGPGTGKTTTVTKLLSAISEQGLNQEEAPVIKLVAPTGKAAARLTESIGNAVGKLGLSDEVRALIPNSATTIHRLLGAMPNRAEFRHNESNPIHADVLVVDEASMVDLPLMYKLLDALPSNVRLILLGDKDQLASVEAGAVLGDLCSYIDHGYGEHQHFTLSQLTGYHQLPRAETTNVIADSLCMLRKSYRFDERSGIGQLAKQINLGSVAEIKLIWQKMYADIEMSQLSDSSYQQLITQLAEEYSGYLSLLLQSDALSKEQIARKALAEFARCRLLCANRQGPFGVSGLNEKIEQALTSKRVLPSHKELWYPGRPIMITRNDHGLGLFNGDIGLCIAVEEEGISRLKVFFELADGSIKEVLPARVPAHETAFAMTIHKSQGSEFEHTYIMLPDEYTPILTRELIYTGVTRAKHQLTLCINNSVFMRAVKTKTERFSGLKEALLSCKIN